ncbi:hypothetical protein EVA_11135, partial [gut metagenome]
MTTNFTGIPDELKTLEQWVGVSSDSKVPMKTFESSTPYASSTNPATWS